MLLNHLGNKIMLWIGQLFHRAAEKFIKQNILKDLPSYDGAS